MLDFTNRRVLVLGLGDTGLSLARWLVREGARVHVADTRSAPPHAETLARELPQAGLTCGTLDVARFSPEAIALSPGVDRRTPIVARALARGVPVVGDIEIFALAIARVEWRARVIAITGSNGKSTVTAMVGAMCREAGLVTMVAGNIGPPVLDALAAVDRGAPRPEAIVLELSSFQLESTASLQPHAAALLNVCEDHMDRYASIADYAAAKARIFAGDGVQVLNRDDPWSMQMAQPGRRVATFGSGAPRSNAEWGLAEADGTRMLAVGSRTLLPVGELKVTGLHNANNALAALALACSVELPEAPLLAALRRFEGLPHRLQAVGTVRGVGFFDDSKGTNVGATVAALSGMSRPVVLIAGGDGKGQDFSPLRAAVKARTRAVVLIGRDSETIAAALAGCVPTVRAHDMEEAVRAAYARSEPGDAVLLSPACASFDMFRNYVHRGEVFASAVQSLVKRET